MLYYIYGCTLHAGAWPWIDQHIDLFCCIYIIQYMCMHCAVLLACNYAGVFGWDVAYQQLPQMEKCKMHEYEHSSQYIPSSSFARYIEQFL